VSAGATTPVRFPTVAVSRRTGNLKITIWLAVAVAIHGGLFFAGRQASAARKAGLDRVAGQDDATFVAVVPLPPAKPEPPTITEPEAAPTPPPEAQKRAAAQREKKVTPRSPDEAADINSFKDVGAIGSLSADAIGTGDSDFTVAVGDTGVDGQIGTSGRASGKSTPGGTARVGSGEDQTKKSLKPVQRRDLSRKAKPREGYNQRIKAEYPAALHEAGVSGQVRAVLTIGADGTVLSVRILDATAPEFAAAAAKVLPRFLFESALDKNGAAVLSEIHITYRFTLE